MPTDDCELTLDQWVHLSYEVTAAQQLLGFGLASLEGATPIEGARESIMTLLAIGVEKLAKMGLGLASVRYSGSWLSKDDMRDNYGHDLVKLGRGVSDELRGHIELATYPEVVRGHLAGIDSDPVWPALLAALARYGKQGRFYELDGLAESPQPDRPPREYWDDAEREAVAAHPELGELFTAASQTPSDGAKFEAALNRRLAASVRAWWEAVFYSGMQGVLGPCGKRWAADLGGPPTPSQTPEPPDESR